MFIKLSFLTVIFSFSILQAQTGPDNYSLARYAVIWENSLFGAHTNGEVAPMTTEHWSLSGVFSFQGGHGAVIVSQANGDLQQVETGKTNDAGFTLKTVVGLDKSEPLRVEVEKNGHRFWVTNLDKKTKTASVSKEISSTQSVLGGNH